MWYYAPLCNIQGSDDVVMMSCIVPAEDDCSVVMCHDIAVVASFGVGHIALHCVRILCKSDTFLDDHHHGNHLCIHHEISLYIHHELSYDFGLVDGTLQQWQ